MKYRNALLFITGILSPLVIESNMSYYIGEVDISFIKEKSNTSGGEYGSDMFG